MHEAIAQILKRSGETWSQVRDRTDSPVLLCFGAGRDEIVYELSLEAGAKHPFWTIKERTITNDEWWALGNSRDLVPMGTIYPTYPGPKHRRVCAYVSNGRKPGKEWSTCIEPVKVTVELIDS